MLKRIYYSIRFKVKHFPNLLVRLFTKDSYYICEECHKIHKRDGKEVRLDEDKKHLMSHPLWYGSVGWECFVAQQRHVRKVLREALLKDLTGE
jgi:hypothetical protein